jgi:hypothetical protein
MPTRHSRLLIALTLPLLLAPLTGCKEAQEKQPTARPPAPAALKSGFTQQAYEGVTFHYPSDWSSAPSGEGGGQLVTAPGAESDWSPSFHVQVVKDPGSQDLQKVVDEAVMTLRERRDRFVPREQKVLTHPGGFSYGRVEYTSERGIVGMTQWELFAPVPGGKRLLVHASAKTEDWPKYQPAFEEMVNSIRLPPSGG